jgi:hypothetical protein
MEIQIGQHVSFGHSSIGVFRGLTDQGMAKVEIGLDVISNPPRPLVAIVPMDELQLEDSLA